MHVPVACSRSLAEAARVSEATAGAESLMDGVQGGHGFQLLLATSQTSDPAAPGSYPRVRPPPFSLWFFSPFFTVTAFGELRRVVAGKDRGILEGLDAVTWEHDQFS